MLPSCRSLLSPGRERQSAKRTLAMALLCVISNPGYGPWSFFPLSISDVYSDPRSATASSVKITALPAHGQLLLNGKALQVGRIINPVNFANLRYKNNHYTGSDSFSFNAANSSGYALTDATVTLAVSSAPLAMAGNDLSIVNGAKAPLITNATDFGSWIDGYGDLRFAGEGGSQSDHGRTFIIWNAGSSPIHILNAGIGGPNASDFHLQFHGPQDSGFNPLPSSGRDPPSQSGRHALRHFLPQRLRYPHRDHHRQQLRPPAAVRRTHPGRGCDC